MKESLLEGDDSTIDLVDLRMVGFKDDCVAIDLVEGSQGSTTTDALRRRRRRRRSSIAMIAMIATAMQATVPPMIAPSVLAFL